MEISFECDLDQRALLVGELTRGRKLARQLQKQLQYSFPSSTDHHSHETQALLLDKIFSCYSKVLSMIDTTNADSQLLMNPEPMRSLADHSRLRSSAVDDGFGQEHHEQHHIDGPLNNKRKKMLPRWSQNVKLCSEGFDGSSLNDGYSWRKYGQKKIFGAIYPRNYYRCTHRNTQGCLATKQVQKSDEDPTLVQVIYRGYHTCHHQPQRHHRPVHFISNVHQPASTTTTNAVPVIKPEPKPEPEALQQQQAQPASQLIHPQQVTHQLKVEAAGQDPEAAEQDSFIFQSLSFSSSAFFESDGDLASALFSAPPVAATTSDVLNHFPAASPCLNVWSGSGSGCSVATPESDLNETLSALDSVSNSPIGGFDFTLEELGIDLEFNFDKPEIFT